jgi:putative membrane protein
VSSTLDTDDPVMPKENTTRSDHFFADRVTSSSLTKEIIMFRRDFLTTSAVGLALVAGRSITQAAPTPGSPEAKYVADNLALGTMALETSKVAVAKSSKAKVKQFASFEVAEQSTIAEILQMAGASAKPDTTASDAMVKKLQAENGASFDREYVRGQTEGHQKLLSVQETYITNGKDPLHLAVAKLASGQIKEHLVLLAEMI